jgi:DNA ligase-1
LQRLSPAEIEIGIAFLSGSLRQGRIGLGGAIIAGARAVVPASAPTLELVDVDAALDRMAGLSGPGSSAAKTENLRALLGRVAPARLGFRDAQTRETNNRGGVLSAFLCSA